jgi:hypothetical protein
MIWHIFKKDLRLLWPYAAMLTVMQFAYGAMMLLKPVPNIPISEGVIGGANAAMQQVTMIAVLLGGAFLIAALVHQDAIPGARQDWLTRPITRKHLLLSKILSVILLIHVPMLVVDLLYALANGFPFGSSAGYAVSRNILVLIVLSFPILAFASLTKGLMETIAGVFVLAVSMVLLLFLADAFYSPLRMVRGTTQDTGFYWVPQFLGYLVAMAGSVVVLVIQYSRRKTRTARLIAGFAWLLFLAIVTFLPWDTAFAIEKQFSVEPGAGNPVSFSFDPSAGKIRRVPTRPSAVPFDWYLPLRVEGLTPDTAIRIDRYSTRAFFTSGETSLLSIDRNADFLQNGPGRLHVGFDPLTNNPLLYPGNDPRVQGQVMQVEIEMSATLLRRTSVESTTMDGSLTISGVPCTRHGWMITSDWDDDSVTEASISCAPVLDPVCYTLTFENPPAPYVSVPVLKCAGQYQQFVSRVVPGAWRVTAVAHLHDPINIGRLPERQPDLLTTKATVNVYEPVDHFTKKIVIPNIRFQDWTADFTAATPSK